MSMVGFPLLLIPLAIYNIIVFLMPGLSFAEPLVTVPLMSGAPWPVTLSDGLLALGILMLLLEVMKGARPGAKYLTDHLLSLLVFGAAIAEFLLWPRFASSTYFLLVLLALVDFLSGVALRVQRGVPATVSSGRGGRRAPAEELPAEIRQEPSDFHAEVLPPANEPELASHSPSSPSPSSPAPSEPKFTEPETVHPETAPVAAASEASPSESKPGSGAAHPPEATH
ncbi:hypothetical protein [Bradyrhizobium sp.]|jgi:hypothetical protein|uniref:hypothetical protein n=1 Tax=Bradyrhizobium sp. TaxID=376 RepID=UPI003C6F2A44